MGKIVVTVKRGGASKVEAFDFNGPECAQHTGRMVQALGGAQDEYRKPEYYEGTELQQNEGA